MKLKIASDASYNSETRARSRAAGYYYLDNNNKADTDTTINGNILVVSQLIDVVVSSAAEAEYAALFINGKTGLAIRNTLKDLGYTQGNTIIETDNVCAQGIANETNNIRKAKSMDMRFHWIRDQRRQGTYMITWAPGKGNDRYVQTILAKHIQLVNIKR
jgi:hypothetical protein